MGECCLQLKIDFCLPYWEAVFSAISGLNFAIIQLAGIKYRRIFIYINGRLVVVVVVVVVVLVAVLVPVTSF